MEFIIKVALIIMLVPINLLAQSIDLELTKRVQKSVSVNLLDNDFNSGSFATIVTDPLFGNLAFSGSGSYTYTPDGTQEAPYEELITYEVCHQNNSNDCQLVDLKIVVEGDTGPIFSACEDFRFFPTYSNPFASEPDYTIDVLANDMAVNPFSLNIVLAPISGSVSLQNNKVIYSPSLNFQGVDEFLYTVNSADGSQSDQIKVTIVVGNTNNLIPVRDCAYLSPKQTATVGEEFCYAIVVENLGPNTATNVRVYDQLPSEVSFVSDTHSQGFYSTSTSTWVVGSMPAGEVEELEICVVADESGDFTNVAQVSSVDQNDSDSNPNNDNGDQSEDDESSAYMNVAANSSLLNVKAYLKGPFNGFTMEDDLRDDNLIPLQEPYSADSNFDHNGSEQISSSVLNQSGFNAIVDWILIELRYKFNPSVVLYTRAALIQRDGDIVDVNGFSPVSFEVPSTDYYVALRHRNHLGVMTAQAVNLNSTIDFTNPNQDTWGNNAQFEEDSNTMLMWSGNSNSDDKLIMQGANNDSNSIFFEVLQAPINSGNQVNFIYPGYFHSDTNMDGRVIFQGANNDPNTIFFNILTYPANSSFSSNYIINEQLP